MYQPFLKDRVAIVTGGAGSIGKQICVELAAAGAHVVVAGRNATTGPAVASEIAAAAASSHGNRVVFSAVDLRSRDSMEQLVRQTVLDFGKLDIVVNCGGVQHVAPVDALAPEHWDEIIAVNLSSVFHMTQLALPCLRSSGWGRIVNIASVLGLVGCAEKGAYVASKHGVVGLTKATALETAQTPITCNAVCPGFVDTPLLRTEILASAEAEYGGNFDKAVDALMTEYQPSKHFVSAQQVAQTVVFLCSSAADEIRGSTITPDGASSAK